MPSDALPPKLVDYFKEYLPQKKGRTVSRRTGLKFAREFNLPIVKVGHTSTLIDPVEGDRRIAARAQHREPNGRGRPPKHNGA